jgi:hypothetical protein
MTFGGWASPRAARPEGRPRAAEKEPGVAFGRAIATEYVPACRIRESPSLPDDTDEDVTPDIPTRILSGGIDAQTPTFRSEVVARSLPDAHLVRLRVAADGLSAPRRHHRQLR